MRHVCAFLTGVVLFLLALVGFKLHMDSEIAESKVGVRNLRTYERYQSNETQKIVIEENTLPVFGSSELLPLSRYEDEIGSFLNGDEMNIVTIGGGNFQSLYHSIALGALSENIPSKKVALFLSPQWFVDNGCDPAAYAARMSENELLDFLNNHNVSKELKLRVLERNEQLLANSPTQLARIQRYSNALENPISIDAIYTWIMRQFWSFRAEYEVYRQLDSVDDDVPQYDLSALDFDALLQLAEEQGASHCTNNNFGVYDEYWSAYVAESYAKGEVIDKKQNYTQSPEYDDLMLFLDVAKDLDFEVILVSIPVNAKWYEYQGFLCDEYYQNIRNIAAQYSNVTFADMSIYDEELYFLKDVMHLGWKGWVRINEVLYKEFTEQ